jgi:hypothetical protein
MNSIAKHSVVFVAAAALVSLATASCGMGRIQQCNKLIEKVNAAGSAVSKAGSGGKGNEMGDMAKSIDTAKAEITAVQLEDAKLKGFQADYVKMLDKISTAAKGMQGASAKNDMATMQASLKEIQAASEDEKTIVTNINTYCTTGK